MKIRSTYTCPLEFVHDIIKGKWKPIIIFNLRKGPLSLSELEKSIEGMSQKMLLEHLKDLQLYDIVQKTSFEGYPLRVEYALTKTRGREILKAVEIMQDIGTEIIKENHK